ncbi:sodium:solute symporter family protein [Hippea alviniae]|uniref:sodium:solute symporter family protein n=1 Tax=Hippea alviniae TaxID=1279027 RepID=UPI0003B3D7A6|nr:sodium:solute symporter [Hippea alviniae]
MQEIINTRLLFVILLIIISFFVILKSKSVKSEKDFTIANRKLTSFGVSNAIIGTLVGGAATIGTVQLAYMYGLAAWIFTLFSGVACLFLGAFFSKALRSEEVVTVSEFIGNRFGNKARVYTSVLSSIGMYIHIVAQFLAAMSIIETVFGFNATTSMIITFILILIFVLSGGIVSSSLVGEIKTFMLYILMLLSASIVIIKQNGISNLIGSLPDKNMLSIFSYGKSKAIQDMIAMVIGVLSTQTYLQAIFSAKDVRTARNGAFLSALLIPPIGLMGILVGMYMRIHHPELINNTVVVFPYFLKFYFNPILTALFLSFLTIITLGTASGLTLGVTTNLYVDVLKSLIKKNTSKGIREIKTTGFLVLASSMFLVVTGLHSAILSWSYLSMGIRGSAVFLPLLFIILIKDEEILNKLKPIIFIAPFFYILISIALR